MVNTMADYLPVAIADYTYTLNVTPQAVLPQEGDRKQVVHEYDDGTVAVVTLAQQSQFNIRLQWTLIADADASIILDLYHDPNKANGRAYTFYFYHPIDEREYVVRFMTPLTQTIRAGFVGYRENPEITLRAEGVKGV